jgi:hypothetical protein
MTHKDNGGPAFPGETVVRTGVHGTKRVNNSGMSLRDYFAGQALGALIRKAPFFDRDGEFGKPIDMLQFKADMSASAYAYADAMLSAREAKP